MRFRTLIGAAAAAGLGLTAFGNAEATPVTYAFTVTATDGPLAGTTETGTFTYDTSIVPPGGGSVGGTNLLTALHFTWDGITYDQTTANTGNLGFDASGSLFTAEFGTNCLVGGCSITSGFEQWAVSATVLGTVGGFGYAVAGVPGQFDGNAILTLVPEPSVLSLFAFSMAGLAFAGMLRTRRD